MTTLPIAERELRVAARSPRTYWSRALAALVLMIISIVVFDSYERFGRAKVGGQQIFAALSYLALAYALFAGTALTADCISSEKREETLGFLFLTDLKGYDVVLGKLVATSLRSVYGLLATFPIMSLPLLLGGVQAAEFWRVILVILNTLLLSLSLGLLISTLFRRQRVTTHLAAVLMLLLALVPVGVGLILRSIAGAPPPYGEPGIISPLYSLQMAFDPAYKMARVTGPSFWSTILVQFVLGILLLARASWLLPRSWQEAAKQNTTTPVLVRQREARRDRLHLQRRRMLDQNPFYWLAGRGWGMTLGLTSIISFVGAWGFLVRDDRDEFAMVQGVGILLVALVTRLLIAVLAAQRLADDKQSGALDLIITTPIAIAALLEGQWQAIWKKLGWPFLGSLILYGFLIFGGPSSGITNDQERIAFWFTCVCFFVLTVADSIALGWLGIWSGLRFRHVPHGAALCLCKVVLPPALIAGSLIWNHGLTSADEFFRIHPFLVQTVWLTIGLAIDVAWGRWAHQKLLAEFRSAAADRFQRVDAAPSRWWDIRVLWERTSAPHGDALS